MAGKTWPGAAGGGDRTDRAIAGRRSRSYGRSSNAAPAGRPPAPKHHAGTDADDRIGMPIARINAATKAVSGEPPAADRARAVLLAWRRVWKNRLRGFCSIGLPNGLLIDDIAVHVRGGRAWVSLPAELELDAEGRQ